MVAVVCPSLEVYWQDNSSNPSVDVDQFYINGSNYLQFYNVISSMKKSVMTIVMTGVVAFVTMSQKIVVTSNYVTNKMNEYPYHYMHSTNFETKDDAILNHKIVLSMNGIDTSKTSVEYDLDAPIFSNFLDKTDKKMAIVTYVRKNVFGGYTSCFIECDNVTFKLFESDGYILTHYKIK